MKLKNIRMFGLVMFACLLSCLPKLQFSSNPRSKPGRWEWVSLVGNIRHFSKKMFDMSGKDGVG